MNSEVFCEDEVAQKIEPKRRATQEQFQSKKLSLQSEFNKQQMFNITQDDLDASEFSDESTAVDR